MGFIVNDIVKTGGLPKHIVLPLINYCDVPTFIESGTAGGETIRSVSHLFRQCHTIELIEGRAIQPEYSGAIGNIKWHTGNSVDILPKIIDELIEQKNKIVQPDKDIISIYNYAMFWLDAHYSDPEPNTSEFKECPVMEELEIISRYCDDAIILIDDARLFMGQPPYPNNPKDWPMIQDIFVLLKEKFKYNYSTIVDDYILSLPDRLREPIDAEWRGNFSKRYPSAEVKLKADAKNVFNAIKKYLE